ncbi:hypothetical protein LCGC14_2515780 [marine sediment metagenome]|uniref:Uncharacterized protein n=1 Tax=marine sediment metagenome TaxID=412755 RepID=A0A0F9BKS9_9ZZZZ
MEYIKLYINSLNHFYGQDGLKIIIQLKIMWIESNEIWD